MLTNSKIFYPDTVYNSSGGYLWFSNIDVEPRDRVKHMSLRYGKYNQKSIKNKTDKTSKNGYLLGVPVSSQWNKNGHLYPVQITQFGLSHFSKWVVNQRTKKNKPTKQLPFIVKDKIKFIHHENENAEVNLLTSGFEFKFPGKYS